MEMKVNVSNKRFKKRTFQSERFTKKDMENAVFIILVMLENVGMMLRNAKVMLKNVET